jgi:hypothetical protein
MQIIISTEYLTVKPHVQVRKMNDFVESVEFSKFKKKKKYKENINIMWFNEWPCL